MSGGLSSSPAQSTAELAGHAQEDFIRKNDKPRFTDGTKVSG